MERNINIDIKNYLEEQGVNFKETSTGELIIQCYECGRSKLYVKAETGLFNCFRCNVKGNIVKLIHELVGLNYDEANKLAYGKKNHNVFKDEVFEEKKEDFSFSLGGLKKKTLDSKIKSMVVAPEFEILKETHVEAFQYLIKRGYTPEDIKKLRLLVLPHKTFGDCWKAVNDRLRKQGLRDPELKKETIEVCKYHERIVFPVYVDFEIMGYVARDYTGTKSPKVLNSSGNFRSFSVWNYDNAKDSKDLIICEGNSSAVKCGIDRSIALLGKVATQGQVRLLRKTKAENIYICLDVGAEADAEELYKSFVGFYPNKIHMVELPPIYITEKNISREVNEAFGFEWSYDEEKKEMYAPLKDIKSLFLRFKINPKDMKEKKISDFLKATNKILSPEIAEALKELIFNGEYKDAGDYSHEEMNKFISEAKIYRITRKL